MHMYRLAGSYRQIGAEYGLIVRGERLRVPLATPVQIEFAARCEPHVRAHAPGLLDEIDGIAAECGHDPVRVRAAALSFHAIPACSVIAIAGQYTADGRPLVGRNFDWTRGSIHYAVFCHARPEGAQPSLALTDHLVGRYGGINAAGLAVGMASVDGGRHSPGIMFPLAIRIMLDQFTTTAEAVEFLQTIRHARAVNFLVADASGDIAYVEAHPLRVEVLRPADGFGVITNHFRAEAMAAHEYARKRPPDTLQRYRRLREWFLTRSELFTPAHLQAVLGCPKPQGVRMGDPRRRTTFDTIWSWTARLGAGELELAPGTPGDVPYRTFTFD